MDWLKGMSIHWYNTALIGIRAMLPYLLHWSVLFHCTVLWGDPLNCVYYQKTTLQQEPQHNTNNGILTRELTVSSCSTSQHRAHLLTVNTLILITQQSVHLTWQRLKAYFSSFMSSSVELRALRESFLSFIVSTKNSSQYTRVRDGLTLVRG